MITIEGAWGLGSAVVGGEVTPDRWVLGKITGEISVREISEKLIQHVPAAGRRDRERRGGRGAAPDAVHERCGAAGAAAPSAARSSGTTAAPQDIEWAVERGTNEILLLQSRPETVWSAKEAAPVARAAADPLSHVMSIFGGRR